MDPNIPTVEEVVEEMNKSMSDFSYVKYAEENKSPPFDLNFGSLNEGQSLKIRIFMDEHCKIHGHYAGAIGGRFSWIITGTSIGICIAMKCSCDEKIDVTDFSDW